MDIIEAAKKFEEVGKEVLKASQLTVKCSFDMVAIAMVEADSGDLSVYMLPELAFITMVQDAMENAEIGENTLAVAMLDSFIDTAMA